jgi:hypothetical protein
MAIKNPNLGKEHIAPKDNLRDTVALLGDKAKD